jgi:L-threonylcarbamoyladenylate synthase
MVARADDPGAWDALVRVLAAGKVAVAPCDTMYGLVGISPESEQRLRQVKGRGEDKPFLLLLAEASWSERLSDASIPDRLLKYWPGALTLVISARGGGTVAVRVPDSPFLHDLLLAVGKPLYSTSVNRAGDPPLLTVEAMRVELESDVDLIFDAGDMPPGPPSTLLDVTARPYKILRQGALRLAPEDLA